MQEATNNGTTRLKEGLRWKELNALGTLYSDRPLFLQDPTKLELRIRELIQDIMNDFRGLQYSLYEKILSWLYRFIFDPSDSHEDNSHADSNSLLELKNELEAWLLDKYIQQAHTTREATENAKHEAEGSRLVKPLDDVIWDELVVLQKILNTVGVSYDTQKYEHRIIDLIQGTIDRGDCDRFCLEMFEGYLEGCCAYSDFANFPLLHEMYIQLSMAKIHT